MRARLEANLRGDPAARLPSVPGIPLVVKHDAPFGPVGEAVSTALDATDVGNAVVDTSSRVQGGELPPGPILGDDPHSPDWLKAIDAHLGWSARTGGGLTDIVQAAIGAARGNDDALGALGDAAEAIMATAMDSAANAPIFWLARNILMSGGERMDPAPSGDSGRFGGPPADDSPRAGQGDGHPRRSVVSGGGDHAPPTMNAGRGRSGGSGSSGGSSSSGGTSGTGGGSSGGGQTPTMNREPSGPRGGSADRGSDATGAGESASSADAVKKEDKTVDKKPQKPGDGDGLAPDSEAGGRADDLGARMPKGSVDRRSGLERITRPSIEIQKETGPDDGERPVFGSRQNGAAPGGSLEGTGDDLGPRGLRRGGGGATVGDFAPKLRKLDPGDPVEGF